MNDEMFYGTLPQDTQDFTQVLRGVGRNIRDISRGVSYYPYDVLGAPVDIINMALQPVGLGSQTPVLGSDYLRNIAQSLGYAQPSTGSGAETAGRFGAAFVNPAAGARAVGQAGNLVTRGANISADKLVQMITQNPRATAMGVVDETAMPFMQAVAPKAPSLLEPQKSDIGFYSQLEAATIPLQNKGTGDQYLAQISKTAGVKPEEIQWTGLDEFLKGKKSVTKDEILNYLNTNRVDVQEVRIGEGFDAFKQKEKANLQQMSDQELADHLGIPFNARQQAAFADPIERNEIINSWVDSNAPLMYGEGIGGGPKFSGYTLPGGENYREILLTLPSKEIVPMREQFSMYNESGELISQGMWPPSRRTQEVIAEHPEFRIERTMVPDRSKAPEGTFVSSHFAEPNILAHMRVNDRVVDGKKTLFIEEIQSDWHQAGRKEGYSDPQALQRISKEIKDRFGFKVDGSTSASKLARAGVSEDMIVRWEQAIEAGLSGVPDAPFKTSWHELSLKRAIQEASEKGYDQIAFTTGKTQAERYDLSKQVDSIVYGKEDDGTYSLVAIKDGREVVKRDSIDKSALPDVVGKEVADRMVANEGKRIPGGPPEWELSGENLRVGGEGMKGFYDNILPKSLDKLAKKFDAKVGKTEMDGVEVWQMDITPKMRESVTTKGQPLFAVPAIGAGLLGAGMVQDEQMY